MKERKELNVQIGQRVRKARETAGYTQEKVSDLIDVSPQFYSDMERGVVGASLATIVKLCDTLGASADYILMGRESEGELPASFDRLKYLTPSQLELVERGVSVLLEAVLY